MSIMITFDELRRIKDSLPTGSMQKIADELGISPETVRNYLVATIMRKVNQQVCISSKDPVVVWCASMTILY